MDQMTPKCVSSESSQRSRAGGRQGLQWVMVAVLCFAAGAVAEEKKPDQRHLEAQAAYDKAKALYEAGEYSPATEQGEQALTLAPNAL